MAIRVRIYGKVQGVWYRGWTSDQATRLGLSGWVRNRRDGSVEALFDGADEIVDEMIARCHEGPPAAVVDRVEVTGADSDVEEGFRQLPTL